MRRRPNVLLLMTDQQQARTVDPLSHCITPSLDRLSKEGVRFSRAYTPNAICSPARASLFTGLLPHSHGMVDCTHTVDDYRARLKEGLDFWSQHLREAGYKMGYFGKWHVERSNQLNRFGFDEFELSGSQKFAEYRRSMGLPPKPERFSLKYSVRQKGYRDFTLYGAYDEPVEATSEYYIYSRGIEFIRDAARNGSRPWCLVISTQGPHDPYIVPEGYCSMYDPKKIPKPANFNDDLSGKPNIYKRIKSVWRDLTWENYAQATACYYAFCTMIDEQVGRALEVLDETGQSEDTIVIYTTDHGDMMGGHGLMLKGVPPFEEVYNIPLIIKWPSAGTAGAVRDELVNLCDIAPTILEMTDCGKMSKCEGRSIAPLLRGERDWDSEAFAEFHGQRFFYTQRIIWNGRYKYVFNGFDFDELYDLENDPGELVNLAHEPDYKDVSGEMASKMWAKIRDTGDHNMFNARYGMFRFAPVGPDTEEDQPRL
ncbi:MAG: sulfatase-like hydrolase/transferase [bacterium]